MKLNNDTKLGRGGYGEVYKVIHKQTKRVFALKKMLI